MKKLLRSVIPNYLKITVVNIISQIADAIAQPKTVLTWLMIGLGVSPVFISFVVPIRESGSMIPQIFIAEFLKTKKFRKKFWIYGSLIQSISLFSIGLTGLYATGNTAGWIIIISMIFFSFGRAWCSIVSKDILGKVIPKSTRGKLLGYANMISGIGIFFVGYIFITYHEYDFLSYTIIIAAVIWIIAAILYSLVYETPGDVTLQPISLSKALAGFSVLKTDALLRNFIIARSLLLAPALTAPFYLILAENFQYNVSGLGLFVIVTGFASIISSPFWGRLADNSSRKTIFFAALITASIGCITMLIIHINPGIQSFIWFYPLIIFILTVAHQGIRIGRKTYIVDIATGNTRTEYVSISNTIIGIVLLFVGMVTSLLSLISIPIVIVILSLLGLIGAYLSYQLPEA